MSQQINSAYEFGPFRLVPSERLLLRDGEPVALKPKALDTLVILVQHNGHIVKKDQLIKMVWPDAFVEESNLNHYVSILRKALNDGGDGAGHIETIRRHGFRFTADVRETIYPPTEVSALRHTRTQVVIKEQQTETQTRTTAWNEGDHSRPSSRSTFHLLFSAAVVLLIIGGAYFVYIRHAQSRNVRAASPKAFPVHANENPAARAAYLKGRAFWERRTPEDMREAVRLFHEAITIDPNYARGYAGLADAYLLGGSPPDETESFTALVQKALSLDDTLAEPHVSLAYYLSAVDWNWREAEREFRRGIELDPNYATAHHWYAYHLTSVGRIDEALAEISRAKELAPDSLIIATDVGEILYMGQQYSGAIEQYRKVLEKDPNFGIAHLRLGEAYAQVDEFRKALEEILKAKELGIEAEASLAYLYAVSGRQKLAKQTVHGIEERVRKGELHDRTGIAWTYAVFGDRDSAFAWLEEGYRRHDGKMALLLADPKFQGLHPDPRFNDLLRRMNLN